MAWDSSWQAPALPPSLMAQIGRDSGQELSGERVSVICHRAFVFLVDLTLRGELGSVAFVTEENMEIVFQAHS